MNFRPLTNEDIEVFSETISTFFKLMTRRPAEVRTAYVLDGPVPIIWNDFNGVIDASSGFRGTISFSAPRGLLIEVLRAMGESQHSTENFLDVVGEIANQMSGRARKHFGESLDIAPPRAFERTNLPLQASATGPAYAIPLTWGMFEANLVVHLDVLARP